MSKDIKVTVKIITPIECCQCKRICTQSYIEAEDANVFCTIECVAIFYQR